MIAATQLKVGMTLIHKGELCRIVKLVHITPGNWRGMVQTKMVNLIKGNNVEYRFRSDESVETVRLEAKDMEYIYHDDEFYYFMDIETFEQIPIAQTFLEDSIPYLLPNIQCTVEFHESRPVGITLPKTIDLVITDTEPQIKGATASSSLKPAVTETGLTVTVPPFIKIGDKVRIDITENKYIERVKE